jgi:hypothetical protein
MLSHINSLFLPSAEALFIPVHRTGFLSAAFNKGVSCLKKSFPHLSIICFLSFQIKEEMDTLSEIVEGH